MATLRNIIKDLRKQGHTIRYENRKGGGLLIKSIDKVKFSGYEGNELARQIKGVNLTIRQQSHIENITPQKGVWGQSRKGVELPKALQSKLRRVQRIWRKSQPNTTEKVTKANVLYNLRTYGAEETMRRLNQRERYGQGYALFENINALKERIERFSTIILSKEEVIKAVNLNEVLDKIEEKRLIFQDKWIEEINNIIYNCEKINNKANKKTRMSNIEYALLNMLKVMK